MNSCEQLPERYEKIKDIDLLKNKKEALVVNMLSAVLFVLLFIAGNVLVPVTELFDGDIKQLILLLILQVVYIVAHEAVHGIFMKCYLRKSRLNFGYKVIYAYAGSDGYFCKKHYKIIALAPLVILGSLLLVLNLLMKENFFWPIYFAQIMNVSGAAGDMYVFYLMSKMPGDILVNDTGISMTLYAKTE